MLCTYYIPAKHLRKITSKSVLRENLLPVKSYALGTKGKSRQGGQGKGITGFLLYILYSTQGTSCIFPVYTTSLNMRKQNLVIRQRIKPSALTLLMCTVFGIQNCKLSLHLTYLHASHLRQFSHTRKLLGRPESLAGNSLRATSDLLPTSALCQKTVKKKT